MELEPIDSRMSIRGHPIHSMLVHFPVAALLGLIATDGAFLYTQDFFWARASLWLAGVGAIGGWISGLVGFIDLVSVRNIRRLITGWCHAVLAVLLLSLASFNWLLRVGDAGASIMPMGFYISLLSGFVMAVTANLGGRLVYEHAVGVKTE
ncbi:MAG: DUF2231 domain-containing protein [Pseudomonadota bacterium]